MARINEAWSVLSDPARRAAYDSTSSSTNGSAAPSRDVGEKTRPANGTGPAFQAGPHNNPIANPAHFPWKFVLVMATLGIAFVVINAALTDAPKPLPLDNILGVGSCVSIDVNGDAAESACNGTNDGVVDSLLQSDGVCRQGTEMHRDRQGLGQVCVIIASSG